MVVQLTRSSIMMEQMKSEDSCLRSSIDVGWLFDLSTLVQYN